MQEKEIKSIFQGINPKKSTGEDLIPPKLVKIASNVLIKPDAINSSIRTSNFPKNAKRAAVVPLDKDGTDKTSIGNFRPVSILNIFSKFYEKIIQNQLEEFLDKHLSIFLSAYIQLYIQFTACFNASS